MRLVRYLGRRAIRGVVLRTNGLPGRGRLVAACRRKLMPGTGSVLVQPWSGVWMELDLESHIEREIYFFGGYRPVVAAWYAEQIRPGMTVLDIGANVGSYALLAAQHVGPSGRVIAVEADPVVCERLKRNVALNPWATVECHSRAIFDSIGQLEFYQNAKNDQNQGQGSLAAEEHHQRTISVRCVTVDDFLPELGLRRIDVMKIDTQGAEVRVIRGACATLERDRPVVFWRSAHEKSSRLGDAAGEVIEALLDLDYTIREYLHGRSELTLVTSPVEREDATYLAIPRPPDLRHGSRT